MAKIDSLDALLQRNPKAAPHGASIRETLEAVRKLREAGVSSEGKHVPQMAGRRSISDIPRPMNRKIVRLHSN